MVAGHDSTYRSQVAGIEVVQARIIRAEYEALTASNGGEFRKNLNRALLIVTGCGSDTEVIGGDAGVVGKDCTFNGVDCELIVLLPVEKRIFFVQGEAGFVRANARVLPINERFG